MKKKFFISIIVLISIFSTFLCSCDVLDQIQNIVPDNSGDSTSVVDEIDYQQLINDITLKTMQSNVKVEKTCASSVFTGSGVIVKKKSNSVFSSEFDFTYYCLTNNHVINGLGDVKVYDYKGEEYPAVVLFSDADYDLALLSFESDYEFIVVEFANADPKKDDVVFSVGQPESQLNAMTVGKVLSITKPSEANTASSNITFDIIVHSAYINNGSSGGMLIDIDRKLVGVNYAGLEDPETGASLNQYCAVPISKVEQFLLSDDFYI